MRFTKFLALAAALAAIAVAFASADTVKAAGTAVNVTKHATLGDVLTDDGGKTLYLFFRDEREKSNCTGACPTSWPPLTSAEPPVAGAGVTAALLRSEERRVGKECRL